MKRNYYSILFLLMALMQLPVTGQSPPTNVTAKNQTAVLAADQPGKILSLMRKVADWQLANPTGKELNSWEYGPFYIGLMALYNTSGDSKYLQKIKEMGNKVNWEPIARPYDANVLAISQVFLELYKITGQQSMVDKSRFVMDAPMKRELAPDITFDKNKYWWEWWSWCDALFMAPPAYARMAAISKNSKYRDFMVREWRRTSDYLYSKADSLFFRDDRFFTMKSTNGGKIFWSRGNGWVTGGLVRVLQYLPVSDSARPFFEQQYREMCYKLKRIQMPNGFWSQSLLDPENFPQKESSGTGFYVYAITWGINNGLLTADEFLPVVQKGWMALKESVHADGKLGFVQEVGDSPTNVKFDDSETYGTGAFLLAGSELYKALSSKKKVQLPRK
jgi:unsaturated rhamnogalacturonyl hydrolase